MRSRYASAGVHASGWKTSPESTSSLTNALFSDARCTGERSWTSALRLLLARRTPRSASPERLVLHAPAPSTAAARRSPGTRRDNPGRACSRPGGSRPARPGARAAACRLEPRGEAGAGRGDLARGPTRRAPPRSRRSTCGGEVLGARHRRGAQEPIRDLRVVRRIDGGPIRRAAEPLQERTGEFAPEREARGERRFGPRRREREQPGGRPGAGTRATTDFVQRSAGSGTPPARCSRPAGRERQLQHGRSRSRADSAIGVGKAGEYHADG